MIHVVRLRNWFGRATSRIPANNLGRDGISRPRGRKNRQATSRAATKRWHHIPATRCHTCRSRVQSSVSPSAGQDGRALCHGRGRRFSQQTHHVPSSGKPGAWPWGAGRGILLSEQKNVRRFRRALIVYLFTATASRPPRRGLVPARERASRIPCDHGLCRARGNPFHGGCETWIWRISSA